MKTIVVIVIIMGLSLYWFVTDWFADQRRIEPITLTTEVIPHSPFDLTIRHLKPIKRNIWFYFDLFLF